MRIIYMTGTNCTTYLKNRPHAFIAIHFTAGVTSRKGSARNTASWFKNPQNRNGSADWIVDDDETVCYNDDPNRYCWAVGDDSRRYSKGGWLYGTARNRNTISIEICSTSRTGKVEQANSSAWYFTDAAINNALNLAVYLMKRYNVSFDHVVRHYDISGKFCPGIIGWNANSGSDAAWNKFKERLKEMTAQNVFSPTTQPKPNTTIKKETPKMSVLKKGSKGYQVKVLQLLLLLNGYGVGKSGADGDFGNATHNAVVAYQKAHGLVADGIVGPKTWAALLGC